MDLDELVTESAPPPNRVGKCVGATERHLTEGAIMVAYAMHLFRAEAAKAVRIHPDGEHGKRFNFRDWLARQGFNLVAPVGSTSYGGGYADKFGRTFEVIPRPGFGDVVATLAGGRLVAECKGGIINTRHPGQTSRLYKGLCEVVGLLMASPSGGRQVAVVPHTEGTLRLARRLLPRRKLAGIEIALVGERGTVIDVADVSTDG
jgi:hypothetical protein